MLEVSVTADADEIKPAFRTKAKRLHPDINPSPIAAKQFQRLSEAYEILSDPERRNAYDAKSGRKKPSSSKPKSEKPASEKQTSKAGPDAEKESKEKKDESSRSTKSENANAQRSKASQNSKKATDTEKPDAKPKASKPSGAKPEVCQCGKVTAQPRYIVFDMVAGKGRRVERKPVAGIFCRTCADKAALRASFITWLAGWWAFPSGPKETIKALWNNVRGGRKPADRNTRLLIRQALAFRDKGDLTLARGTAEQALIFARTPDLRREVDKLLLSLSAHKAKALKTRWDKPGWAALVQVAPALVVILWLSMTLTLSTPQSLTRMVTDAVDDPRLGRTPSLHPHSVIY